jgi:hypothetical protein
MRRRTWTRRLLTVVAALAAVMVAIQLVPYGRDHAAPAVVAPAPWPDGRAAEIARTSCADCHSSDTEWPWYSNVAPMSWLVQWDVDRGRDEFDLSNWPESAREADDAIELVEEGAMPPRRYTLLHPGAALTDEERRVLVDALRTMGADGDGEDRSGHGGGGRDDGRDGD